MRFSFNTKELDQLGNLFRQYTDEDTINKIVEDGIREVFDTAQPKLAGGWMDKHNKTGITASYLYSEPNIIHESKSEINVDFGFKLNQNDERSLISQYILYGTHEKKGDKSSPVHIKGDEKLLKYFFGMAKSRGRKELREYLYKELIKLQEMRR